MQNSLIISIAYEALNEGLPEECAAFGQFVMKSHKTTLTEGFDYFVNNLRPGPLVSGYHAAEWFAWNWWRLRWEPRSTRRDWSFAHSMTSIGEGYVWPNITIHSDGIRTAIISQPSSRADEKPFRYVGSPPLILPASTFETAIDTFIQQIMGRLAERGVAGTNLGKVWHDVLTERSDPYLVRYRKLEALLGRDADAIGDNAVEQLLADTEQLGAQAVDEIAASSDAISPIPHSATLSEVAAEHGFDARPADMIGLATKLKPSQEIQAWELAIDAARKLRQQVEPNGNPISSRRLADMAGTTVIALHWNQYKNPLFSYSFDKSNQPSRYVLRSRHETGRRFDLARLIGDRLLETHDALRPATASYTYRQKFQKAFAAEFLCPIEAVDEFLSGDYSSDGQESAAQHFMVSPMTINSLLKNHGRIYRDDADFETTQAYG